MNKDEAIVWIKDFLSRIETQDNRGTASPLLYLLQRKIEYVAHPEYHHQTETIFYHPEMEGRNCETLDEAKQWLVEYGYEGEKLDKEIENIEEFQMGHYWETDQAFLTEHGLNRHKELNGHNLRKHRDYVVHCFRNPEMKELFEVLRVVLDGWETLGPKG